VRYRIRWLATLERVHCGWAYPELLEVMQMRKVLYAGYLIIPDIDYPQFSLDGEEVRTIEVGDVVGRTDVPLKTFYLRNAVMTEVDLFKVL
jgi:hypothetical protein